MERHQWNAAATREWALVELLNEIDVSDMVNHEQFSEWFTSDFVREDRRGAVGAPDADAFGFVGQMQAWFDIGAGAPVFEPMEVLAVGGERLVVIRISVSFVDRFGVEMLHAVLFDPDVVRQQRIVTFDVAARAPAVAELDRLAAVIVDDA